MLVSLNELYRPIVREQGLTVSISILKRHCLTKGFSRSCGFTLVRPNCCLLYSWFYLHVRVAFCTFGKTYVLSFVHMVRPTCYLLNIWFDLSVAFSIFGSSYQVLKGRRSMLKQKLRIISSGSICKLLYFCTYRYAA